MVAFYNLIEMSQSDPRNASRLFACVMEDTLRVIDHGKVAAVFVDTKTDRAVRLIPSQASRVLAREYAPLAPSPWHAQLEAYQIMPDAVLFDLQPVELIQRGAALPPTATETVSPTPVVAPTATFQVLSSSTYPVPNNQYCPIILKLVFKYSILIEMEYPEGFAPFE